MQSRKRKLDEAGVERESTDHYCFDPGSYFQSATNKQDILRAVIGSRPPQYNVIEGSDAESLKRELSRRIVEELRRCLRYDNFALYSEELGSAQPAMYELVQLEVPSTLTSDSLFRTLDVQNFLMSSSLNNGILFLARTRWQRASLPLNNNNSVWQNTLELNLYATQGRGGRGSGPYVSYWWSTIQHHIMHLRPFGDRLNVDNLSCVLGSLPTALVQILVAFVSRRPAKVLRLTGYDIV